MKTRFLLALGAYAFFALLATFTLDGLIRLATWIFFAGLAVKTWIVWQMRKGEEQERDGRQQTPAVPPKAPQIRS